MTIFWGSSCVQLILMMQDTKHRGTFPRVEATLRCARQSNAELNLDLENRLNLDREILIRNNPELPRSESCIHFNNRSIKLKKRTTTSIRSTRSSLTATADPQAHNFFDHHHHRAQICKSANPYWSIFLQPGIGNWPIPNQIQYLTMITYSASRRNCAGKASSALYQDAPHQ